MIQPITPLRQRMLDDMRLRNMADGTRRTYVRSVADKVPVRTTVHSLPRSARRVLLSRHRWLILVMSAI